MNAKRRVAEFDDNPPRPKGGTGDVVVRVGNADVNLTWVNNQLTNIAADDGMMVLSDLKMDEEMLGIVSCFKCARDSDTGQMVCWNVPC